MKKRIISMLLVLCMVLSILPVEALAANPFTDVNSADWYYDSVMNAFEKNLFTGTGDTTFSPEGTMTRGMYLTVMGRMAEIDVKDYDNASEFEDVAAGSYYAPYVQWAVGKGITTGVGDNLFDPDGFVTRQQMATLIVRYFDAYDITYPDTSVTTTPKDIDLVADWAKDAVLKLWACGLFAGDGAGNFNPANNATRAEGATFLVRTHEHLTETKAKAEKEDTDTSSEDYVTSYSVTFQDGERYIERLTATKGEALGRTPGESKTAKENAIFVGWFTDSGFTTPFYYDAPVTSNMTVYAKYTDMPGEVLTLTSFAQLEQDPDINFEVVGFGSEEDVLSAATLVPKDGSDVIPLAIKSASNGVYIVGANGGFNPGSSYELTLVDGYSFKDKPDSVRTASFSIAMPEVQNLSMSDEIIYIKDTPQLSYTISSTTYEVLTPNLVTDVVGTFTYVGGESLEVNDILCFYLEASPQDRDYTTNSYINDPEVYVEVKGIGVDGVVTFGALDNAEDMQVLYKVPDSFTLKVETLPTDEKGTINIDALDIETYKQILGDEYTLDTAKAAISSGDFLLIYESTEAADEGDIYYGEVESYDAVTGEITYRLTTEEAIESCMDLYITPEVNGDDLITFEEKAAIEELLYKQVKASNFAEDAAVMLADMATNTYGTSFELSDDVKLTVELVTGEDQGDQLHFQGQGVQLAIGIDATFEVETADGGKIALDLSAVFVEEVALDLTVSGSAVKKWKIPVGVKVSASIDIKNYTALSINANVYSVAPEEEGTWDKVKGLLADTAVGELLDQIEEVQNKIDQAKGTAEQIKGYAEDLEDLWNAMPADGTNKEEWAELGETLGKTSITKDLMDLLNLSTETGLEAGKYAQSMQDLLDKYSQMIQQETDWIQLVDQEMFGIEKCIYGVAIKGSVSFVVRADINIAMGSSLEYEVGKRYTFWFKIGLFKPSAGNSTMDLIDEKFAFQFYVMGQMGLKMGVAASFEVGIGSTKLASIGITAEVGPYVRLYGFFIYEYEKTRPANTDRWIYDERMAGALYVEFGLYTIMTFDAQALAGLFEYSKELLNQEFPLLTVGTPHYKYAFTNEPVDGEQVRIRDIDDITTNGISMPLPDSLRAMSYLDLTTGSFGSTPYAYSNYNVTLSNPNFSFDKTTGDITVTVPQGVQYMECDLTLTWLQNKLSFRNEDIAVTIPLVWTNLTNAEMNEFFTASVRVGNATDGYQTVWSKRVMKNQPFDLPTIDDIKALLNDQSNLKFARISNYQKDNNQTEDQTQNLTIYTDTVYTVDAEYQVYNVTVSGIENADGTTTNKTYTAKYGDTLDFSDLNETGTNIPGERYTKFNSLETPNNDTTAPITGSYARAILENKVNPTATYMDDSVLATFQFVGLEQSDMVQKLKKGTSPDINDLNAVAEDSAVDIISISPAIGKISSNTTYTVTCGKSQAPDVTIAFNTDGGSTIAPISQKAGSPIQLPIPYKTGYTFTEWSYYVDDTRAVFTATTMPSQNITLTANYTPNSYYITLNANGGTFDGTNVEESILVNYNSTYGSGDPLPTPTKDGNFNFAGWFTLVDGGTLVSNDTIVKAAASHTLYAQWSEKTIIDGNDVTLSLPDNLQYDEATKEVTLHSYALSNISDLLNIHYKRTDDMAWRDSATYPGEYEVKVSLKPEYIEQYAYFEKTFSPAFTITELPYSISSDDGYTYQVIVKTADVKNAGTDALLYAALYSNEAELNKHMLTTNFAQFQIDASSKNNFERGDTDTCVLYAADALTLADVDFKLWWVKKGTASGWKCEWVEIQLVKDGALVASSGQIAVNQWFEEGGDTNFDAPIEFKRTITDVGNFIAEETIDLTDDTTPYTFTYDGMATDTITGTYNSLTYTGTPKLSIQAIYNPDLNDDILSCITTGINTLQIDTTQLKTLMQTTHQPTLQLTLTLTFQSHTTLPTTQWHKTITIHTPTE